LRTPTPLAREMFLANLGATASLARLTIYEIQTWMGDALLVTSSPRLPVYWILIIVLDLPSLLCCRQEMGRHRGSRTHVLCEHWCVFSFPLSQKLIEPRSLQLQLPLLRFQSRSYSTPNHPCDPIIDEEMVDCYIFPDSCGERLLPWCVERRLSGVGLSNSASALIAFFIWRTHRDVHQATSSNLQVCVSV